MNKKKIFTSMLAGTMALTSLGVPAFATEQEPYPATTRATIDTAHGVSMTLHKLIENDGRNELADGLVNAQEDRLPVDNVEFSYYKIADLVSADGRNAAGKAVAGLYYKFPQDSPFLAAMANLNITVAKADINDGATPAGDYYTTEAIEAAIKQAVATGGELVLNDLAKNNGSQMVTNEQGIAKANNGETMPASAQGLYLIAETDISAHDGIANADCWVDTNTGRIHDDRADTTHSSDSAGSAHAEGTEIIQPSNNESNQEWHHYKEGEYFQESTNPEAPIIQTKASPFLVSLPTTNTALVDEQNPGTVWQYDVDVYPKNQTTQIAKRIIDPDEQDDHETLRTHEDYQIGDKIEQVIWADVPALQQNYLNWSNNDRESAQSADEADMAIPDSMNLHTVYKITDTMSDSWTLDDVTKVVLVKKPTKIYGVNDTTPVPGVNTTDHSAMPTKIDDWKFGTEEGDIYYQALNRGTDFQVVDAEGNVINRGSASNTQYHAFTVELLPAGLAKINAAPYASVLTEDQTTHEQVLTPGQEVQMMVFFDSTLCENAKIGETYENQNYPTLTWGTSSMGLDADNKPATRKIDGNEVYSYTYQLNVQKDGVDDAREVKFIIGRTDQGDLAQDANKDLSNYANSTDANGTPIASQDAVILEDGIRWVKEANGVYHVYDYAEDNSFKPASTDDRTANAQHGDKLLGQKPNGDPNAVTATEASDDVGFIEVSEINGQKYYTVTPAEDGSLQLKGFDSNKYTFKEIKTEDESNLLKNTFDVTFTAPDPERNGRFATATVNIDGTATALNIDPNNGGIASLIVNNYDAVDLRTGGRGRMMIYATAIGMAAVLGVAAVATRKREEE